MSNQKEKKQVLANALLAETIHKLMAEGKYACDTESSFQQKNVKVVQAVW